MTMNAYTRTIVILLLGTLSVAMLAACAVHQSMAKKHPMEVEGRPVCSDCHTDGRAAMDHSPDFIKRHRFYASQQKQSCDLCHVQSFCADCHAHKEEIKPSDKYKDAPTRSMPHRGDYLNQHKIDGKINPASCFPCHGRQNNERCKTCHK
jgi:hypothetical protein